MVEHPFDGAVRLNQVGEHRFGGATHADYANMVGPFGGVTAAVMLNAVMQHPQRLGEPVALTVNFAGPVADGPFEINAQPVRTNRSTQHWVLSMAQGDLIACTATVVTATRRTSWSAPEVQPPAGMPPAHQLTPLPGGMIGAAWVKRYDLRFAPEDLPGRFDGEEQPHSLTRLWLRDEPARALDFVSLASMCDAFFPRVFLRRHRASPAGTVSLTTYFHADGGMLAQQGDRHVLGCARGVNFRDGFFDQSAQVWSDAGQLLASSHQVVYYRD